MPDPAPVHFKTAAAFRALPHILLEGRGAVGALDRGADAVLQIGEVIADAEEVFLQSVGFGVFGHR